MSDCDDCHVAIVVVFLVENAVITLTNTICLAVGQFQTSTRTRLACQLQDTFDDLLPDFLVSNIFEVFGG